MKMTFIQGHHHHGYQSNAYRSKVKCFGLYVVNFTTTTTKKNHYMYGQHTYRHQSDYQKKKLLNVNKKKQNCQFDGNIK